MEIVEQESTLPEINKLLNNLNTLWKWQKEKSVNLKIDQ